MSNLFTLSSPKSFLLPITVVITIAVIRQTWWMYLYDLRGPLGLAVIPLIVCPFLMIFPVALAVWVFTLSRSVRKAKNVLPMLVLFVGTFLAFQIPLPSRPDTPEKAHFLANRADYEEVVELARDKALAACDRHGSIRTDIFQTPDRYAHVSAENCLEVNRTWCDYFYLRFFPLESFYHHIVYVESGDADCACGGDPHVEQKIDSNWYVCQYEWN